jgi:hypothetical protein
MQPLEKCILPSVGEDANNQTVKNGRKLQTPNGNSRLISIEITPEEITG